MGRIVSVDVRRLVRVFREGGQQRRVLDELDLSIAQGERLVLLGRSGSGKSTLLNLLAGIDRADSGSIEIQGVRLSECSERARTLFRRRHIGFVYQFFNLLPTLTVAENVALPLELNGVERVAAAGRIEEMLALVGLADRAATFPDRLSGGEQQRVAIARALIHRPSLVLADEPTGNLDAETGAQTVQLLNGLAESLGQTLLTVTHSRQLAQSADRIVTLERGVIDPGTSALAW
jgi:putative ABC transport system ATP-binding protein